MSTPTTLPAPKIITSLRQRSAGLMSPVAKSPAPQVTVEDDASDSGTSALTDELDTGGARTPASEKEEPLSEAPPPVAPVAPEPVGFKVDPARLSPRPAEPEEIGLNTPRVSTSADPSPVYNRTPGLYIPRPDSPKAEYSPNLAAKLAGTMHSIPVPRSPSVESAVPSVLADAQPQRKRTWYSLDPAVAVALVSPLGNWFFGGDYIRNLLLLLLLVYYLHQIIEVPWSLYNSARARRPTLTTPEARLAATELESLEFAYLGAACAAPAVGAWLLQWVSAAAFGRDIISWFSTALFVLATGLRPWGHLIDRLSERTNDLQDLAAGADPEMVGSKIGGELGELRERLERTEAALADAQNELKSVPRKPDVVDYVEDALDALDRAHRSQDRRIATHRDETQTRIAALEEALASLRGEHGGAFSPKPSPLLTPFISLFASRQPTQSSPRQSSPRAARQKAPLNTIPEDDTWTPPQSPQVSSNKFFALQRSWLERAYDVARAVFEILFIPARMLALALRMGTGVAYTR